MAMWGRLLELAQRLDRGELDEAGVLAAVHGWPADEQREAHALARYHAELERHRAWRWSPAQRRARRLLESLLTPEQVRQFHVAHRGVDVIGSAGGLYRLFPNVGTVQKREQWGRRSRYKGTFCFHDPDETLPPADVSIGHLMWLTHDEPGFLREANYSGSRRDIAPEPPAVRVCQVPDWAG